MQKKNQLTWQKHPGIAVPDYLHTWLFYPGSFMQRLRACGAQNPKVNVLRQQWLFPLLDEKLQLDIPPRTYALVREVLIFSEQKKWMFARTVFPRETLTGNERCLARLKSRSLGSVLFRDPNLQRSEFEIACVHSNTQWYEDITKNCNIRAGENDMWARRSLFVLQHKSLLLTEVFLPDMNQLCN